MKQKKTILVTLVMAVEFTTVMLSCDTGGGSKPEPAHVHQWGAWQSNATQHWKECTANDGAKTEVGNHTGDPCTVCGYTNPDQPKNQSATFDNLFGEGYTLIVKGYLTDTEWGNGTACIANKVETAFNARFDTLVDGAKTSWKSIFTEIGTLTINLEKNPTYANFKCPGYKTNIANLNFAILDNAEALRTAINRIVSVMANDTETPLEG